MRRVLRRVLQSDRPRQYRAPVFFYLSREHRLAYLQMPKVACTSIQAAICRLNRPDLSAEAIFAPRAIHRHPEWNDREGLNFAGWEEFFRFTFVRHPIARFLSFHRSKIEQPSELEPRFSVMGLRRGMPIEEVLEVVEAIPEEDLDPHIVPQHTFVVRRGALQVDFIGRIERFAADLELVKARTGAALEIPRLNRTRNDESGAPRAQISSDVQRRLERLYAGDLRFFGYNP